MEKWRAPVGAKNIYDEIWKQNLARDMVHRKMRHRNIHLNLIRIIGLNSYKLYQPNFLDGQMLQRLLFSIKPLLSIESSSSSSSLSLVAPFYKDENPRGEVSTHSLTMSGPENIS